MKSYTKSEQNYGKYPVFTQNFNPRKKKRNSKNLLVLKSTLEEFFNATTHISL